MLSIQERKLIVRMHSKGKNQQTIADLIGCSQPTVNHWISRYKRNESLETRPRSGRPTKLSKEVKASLKKKILNKIESANNNFSCVSTKEIKDLIIEEIDISYSIRHVERIMHQLGFSLIMPRTMHVRHDQEKVDTFRDEFKKNFSQPMWTMK